MRLSPALQDLIQQLRGCAKISQLQPSDCFSQIEQAIFSGLQKDSKRASYFQPMLDSHHPSLTIIHKQAVSGQFPGKTDRLSFPHVHIKGGINMSGFSKLEPVRR